MGFGVRRTAIAFIFVAMFVTFANSAVLAEEDVITEAAGLAVARRALAYATVTYVVEGEERQGVPFLLGGRTRLTQFEDLVAGGDLADDALQNVGIDASGVVVAVLKDLDPNVRFAASTGDDPVLWADATSSLLAQYNIVRLPAAELRAGDLLFFGSVDSVTGVAIITGRTGARIDFVVASAGQGRVIHTFARTDGEYWQNNIVGGGRLALPSFDLQSR